MPARYYTLIILCTIFTNQINRAFGDPHLKTLDGKGYTFNGWGEFTLLRANSSSTSSLSVQIRAEPADSVSDTIKGIFYYHFY